MTVFFLMMLLFMGLCSRVVVILLGLVFVMLIVEVDLAECGKGDDVRNYISWEDLMVDEERLVLRKSNVYNYNEVRVIVVDQNGNGHSKTVQGAVDLVPDWNKHRVKIYIFPGIYRFVIYMIVVFICSTRHWRLTRRSVSNWTLHISCI